MKESKEKVEEYTIVISDVLAGEPNAFVEWVNRNIKSGWKLYGTPYVVANQHCQAMVKYKEKFDSYTV
jgi:hypothetical protein